MNIEIQLPKLKQLELDQETIFLYEEIHLLLDDLTNSSENYISVIISLINQVIENVLNIMMVRNIANDSKPKIERYKEVHEEMLYKIKLIDFLKNEKTNLVVVGTNGAGKTTLTEKIGELFYNNKIMKFSAEKNLTYIENQSMPHGDIHYLQHGYLSSNHHAKNYKFNYNCLILEKFLTVEDKNEEAYISNSGNTVINTWNSLIKTRELYFEGGILHVRMINGSSYSLSLLSSGEKAILHFLVDILLLPKQNYYFIDEPEANLNTAIAIELWDILEDLRSDSTFIYVTHNDKFLQSRKNVNIIWIKSYDGINWDYTNLENSNDLPRDLLISLHGSLKPVLFCEGTINGADHLVYKNLFPEYKVTPVGGHTSVINYTKAFNDRKDGVEYYGIVDNDNPNKGKNKRLHENIFVLPYNEIEMLLIDDLLLNHYLETLNFDSVEIKRKINDFKQSFLKVFEKSLDSIAKELFIGEFNHLLSTIDFSKNEVSEVSNKVNQEINQFLSSEFLNSTISMLTLEITNRNYDNLLEYCSLKGKIVPGLTNNFDSNYHSKILNLLDNPTISTKLRQKIEDYKIERLRDSK